jgi:hypothetical protein
MEHAVDIVDDVDPMSLAIDQAAEHLRSALDAGPRRSRRAASAACPGE